MKFEDGSTKNISKKDWYNPAKRKLEDGTTIYGKHAENYDKPKGNRNHVVKAFSRMMDYLSGVTRIEKKPEDVASPASMMSRKAQMLPKKQPKPLDPKNVSNGKGVGP